jgi:hypothetical protein
MTKCETLSGFAFFISQSILVEASERPVHSSSFDHDFRMTLPAASPASIGS